MEKFTVFVSDTHFNDSQPSITTLFIDFLNKNKLIIESLYLLGDIFETWIGDDEVTETSEKISHLLAQCIQTGMKIYFIRGNRDFLLGEKFTQGNGIHLLEDKTKILLYNQPTLLMHGDLLCTNDRVYQYYRKIMFHSWVKKIALSLPLNLRRAMAKKLRSISEHSQRLKNRAFDAIPQETVIQVLEETHTTLLIHGHIHHPGDYEVPLIHQTGRRLVLGAWESQKGNAIIASQNKRPYFISFTQAIELTD